MTSPTHESIEPAESEIDYQFGLVKCSYDSEYEDFNARMSECGCFSCRKIRIMTKPVVFLPVWFSIIGLPLYSVALLFLVFTATRGTRESEDPRDLLENQSSSDIVYCQSNHRITLNKGRDFVGYTFLAMATIAVFLFTLYLVVFHSSTATGFTVPQVEGN